MDFLKFARILDLCAHSRLQTTIQWLHVHTHSQRQSISVHNRKNFKSSNSHLLWVEAPYHAFQSGIEGNRSEIRDIFLNNIHRTYVVIVFVAHLCLCMWKGCESTKSNGKQTEEKTIQGYWATTTTTKNQHHECRWRSKNYLYKDITKVGKR